MMNRDERVTLYNDCTLRWGAVAQAQQATEECAELIQALSKVFFRGRTDAKALDDLAGELADVKVMVEQIELITGLESKVQEVMEQKLQRLRLRVDDTDRLII